jgi:hypothetical protein
MEMQVMLWPIERLRAKNFAIYIQFEYEEDDGSTLMWGQGKVVDFIRESKDKHVFVKIEWSDKCVRVGNWYWDSSLGGDAWPISSVFLNAGSPLDLCNLILTLVSL